MRRAWLVARSAVLWAGSGIHFAVVCTFIILMGIVIDPRKNDRPQRIFCRTILRLLGARFEARYAPGFDRTRTSLFVSNHVNAFDPFVVYSAIPQFTRGLELESHFNIPIYGWLMHRFGNVPVSENASSPAELKKLFKRTKEALDKGVSLVVFPEGTRTRDPLGRIGPFRRGALRLAGQHGIPVLPVAIDGTRFLVRPDCMAQTHPGQRLVRMRFLPPRAVRPMSAPESKAFMDEVRQDIVSVWEELRVSWPDRPAT